MHIGKFHPRVGDHKSVMRVTVLGQTTLQVIAVWCVSTKSAFVGLCNANHECIAACVEWISLECATLSTDAMSCPGF